ALEAAVGDAWARYHVADGGVRAVESRLDGETVVVNYAVDDVARRGVGEQWIVDYFATGTSLTRYQLVADRMTIHAPDGTVITNRIPDAEIDGNAATWTNGNERGAGGDFGEQTRVTYGSGGVLGTATGYATIGLEVGPSALVRGLAIGFVPGALIGLFGTAIGRSDGGRAAIERVTARLVPERPPVDAATLER
ncbi:hypothetical protein ACFQE6_20765, partial [Natrinema soli]